MKIPPELEKYADTLTLPVVKMLVRDIYLLGWRDGVRDVRAISVGSLVQDDDALALAVIERIKSDAESIARLAAECIKRHT